MKNRQQTNPEFELNIASIIDCFTVLITYLLLTASFITLGVLDVSVAARGPLDQEDTAPPALTVTVGVMKNNDIKINTEGTETKSITIPNKEGVKDFDTLTSHLSELKERFPKLDSVMVTAEDTVDYKELVKTIEITRNTLPQVALGADLENQL